MSLCISKNCKLGAKNWQNEFQPHIQKQVKALLNLFRVRKVFPSSAISPFPGLDKSPPITLLSLVFKATCQTVSLLDVTLLQCYF